MTSPYSSAISAPLARIEIGGSGIGVFLLPPGEHRLVAQALQEHFPDARVEPLSADLVRTGPRCSIALGLPPAQVAAAVDTLNGLRSTLLTQRRLFFVLVDDQEFATLQRSAGDAISVASFITRLDFIPQHRDEAEARTGLEKWLRERYGRLNLRGFVRSEQEDTSFSVEEIYQSTKAFWRRDLDVFPLAAGQPGPGRRARSAPEAGTDAFELKTVFDELFHGRHGVFWPLQMPLSVVLGHPGSGKTFFLRWLALQAFKSATLFGRTGVFPLLIPLTVLRAVDQLPEEQIVHYLLGEKLSVAHLFASLAAAGRVVFLLDGLDEAGDLHQRVFVGALVQKLRVKFPDCPVIITSRVVGYLDAPLDGTHFELAPLDDQQIRRFLIRWCELYNQELFGQNDQARQRGRQEGQTLAREVLAHPSLQDLVRTPLLLTVLALVHRSGLRLPDHRIELYEHAFRVLVERWNHVRSLVKTTTVAPVNMADALRLLGPVALDMLERNERVLHQESLEALLQKPLQENRLRGFRDAGEIIDLFKTNLGLLTEQGPGVFAFLHLTLAEYLAAKELVRSRKLLPLGKDKNKVFRPEWREVVLLGAADLGLVRADDAALDELVFAIVRSASKGGRPTANVPWLLAGLLVDDPCLSEPAARAVVGALIPGWWFEKKYTPRSLSDVAFAAETMIRERLQSSRHREKLLDALRASYRDGLSPGSLKLWANSRAINSLVGLFGILGLDWGIPVLQIIRTMPTTKTLIVSCRWRLRNKVPCVDFSQVLFEMSPDMRPDCQMVDPSPPDKSQHLLLELPAQDSRQISPWDLPVQDLSPPSVRLKAPVPRPLPMFFIFRGESTEPASALSPVPARASEDESD